MEISISNYAKSIGVTRDTIYRWVHAKEKGEKTKLPASVKIRRVVGRYVLIVPKQ